MNISISMNELDKEAFFLSGGFEVQQTRRVCCHFSSCSWLNMQCLVECIVPLLNRGHLCLDGDGRTMGKKWKPFFSTPKHP